MFSFLHLRGWLLRLSCCGIAYIFMLSGNRNSIISKKLGPAQSLICRRDKILNISILKYIEMYLNFLSILLLNIASLQLHCSSRKTLSLASITKIHFQM